MRCRERLPRSFFSYEPRSVDITTLLFSSTCFTTWQQIHEDANKDEHNTVTAFNNHKQERSGDGERSQHRDARLVFGREPGQALHNEVSHPWRGRGSEVRHCTVCSAWSWNPRPARRGRLVGLSSSHLVPRANEKPDSERDDDPSKHHFYLVTATSLELVVVKATTG